MDCDPLDIVLLFDRSGSMGNPGPDGGTKWTSAVASFLSWAELTRNVRVALQLHPVEPPPPPPTCSSSADCGPGGICVPPLGCIVGQPPCDAALYQTPHVPLSPLPSARDAFATALDRAASGGSPLVAALEGGITHARTLAGAHPTGTTIVVLAADGEDNACGATYEGGDGWSELATLAAAGLAGSPSIATHVIAISESLDGFERVAQAGGTTVFGAPSADLGPALSAIQSLYPCP